MTRVEQYKAKVLPSVVNFMLNCSHALTKPSLWKHFFSHVSSVEPRDNTKNVSTARGGTE